MNARKAAQEFAVLGALVMLTGCEDDGGDPPGTTASASGTGGEGASGGSAGAGASGSGGGAAASGGTGTGGAGGGSGGDGIGGAGSGGASTVADCISYCELKNTCPDRRPLDCDADCTPIQGLAAMCGAELAAYYTCMSADPSFYCPKNEGQCDDQVDEVFVCLAAYCDAHPEDAPVCD